MLAAHQLFSDSRTRWHKNPTFMTADACVPGGCAQRVLMHFASRSSRPDQEPSMRRCPILSKLISTKQRKVNTRKKIVSSTYKLHKVVLSQVSWRLVLIDHFLAFLMLLNVTLKEVQGRIISIEQAVLDIILHGHLQLPAGVALANFEQRVTKSFP